ncbi:TMF family protein [Runella salmonicolor]|uniref:TMF family protein n=1 Tax=Runella salmonicolor TaxID=2950278 RepID=A0ABT1FRP8_9BACT|nr:TMF family protein [Runella salmonicolor]MCP1384439.1 TMF family protein [Runella salmonicolor]
MKNDRIPIGRAPFTVNKTETPTMSDELTPEQLIAQANEMVRKAQEMGAQAEKAKVEKLEKDRAWDMETITMLRKEIKKMEFVEKGTTDPEKRAELFTKIEKYRSDISDLEEKYGLNIPAPPLEVATPVEYTPSSTAILVTTLKIAALLLFCWGIVLYSGDWIVAKYPNAAIYNEVSFQKVMFGFSVFIGGFVSVIIALNVFFPGFGKYFNPFNHSGLDFLEDFQTLTPWQRNAISLGLFFCLLFAFVLIAGGKLD